MDQQIINKLKQLEFFRDNLNWDDYKCSAFVICTQNNYQESEQHLKNIVKNHKYKSFIKSFDKAQSIYEAVAVVYCRYAYGFSNKRTIPTKADIRRIDKNLLLFNRCLQDTHELLDEYHNSIDK